MVPDSALARSMTYQGSEEALNRLGRWVGGRSHTGTVVVLRVSGVAAKSLDTLRFQEEACQWTQPCLWGTKEAIRAQSWCLCPAGV